MEQSTLKGYFMLKPHTSGRFYTPSEFPKDKHVIDELRCVMWYVGNPSWYQ